MSKLAKILVTGLIIFVFIIIFGAIVGVSSDAGSTPGILGLIMFAGMVAAVRAVWKIENEDDSSSTPQK